MLAWLDMMVSGTLPSYALFGGDPEDAPVSAQAPPGAPQRTGSDDWDLQAAMAHADAVARGLGAL